MSTKDHFNTFNFKGLSDNADVKYPNVHISAKHRTAKGLTSEERSKLVAEIKRASQMLVQFYSEEDGL